MIVLHKIKKMKGQLTERNQGQIFERAFAREEVWNLYQTVFEQYLKENRTSASMAQVEALFITPQVREQAKRLDEVVTHIDFNLSPESEPNLIQKLEEFYTDADGKLRKLEVAMADEINHT